MLKNIIFYLRIHNIIVITYLLILIEFINPTVFTTNYTFSKTKSSF